MERQGRWMTAWRIVLTAAVLTGVGTGIWYLLRPPMVRTRTVIRRDIREVVQGVGTIEARVFVQIASKITARIVSEGADQGDLVRKGQVLARLDEEQLVAEVMRSEAALQVAQAQYRDLLAGNRAEEIGEARENLVRARAQWDDLRAGSRPQEIAALRERMRSAQATRLLAEKERKRYQQLLSSGYVTQQDMDRALQAHAVAVAQVNDATQGLLLAREGSRKDLVAAAAAQVQATSHRLDLLQAGARPQQLTAAQALVRQAEATVSLAREHLGDTRLTSPFDGYVVSRDLEVGATVSPATPIFKLAESRTLWVTVYVDASESARLAVGNEASIRLQSLREKTLRGRVARIRREGDRVTEQLTVDVAFVDRPSRAILGEQVEVEIRPPARKGVPCLPLGALVRRPEGSGVLVVEDGRLSFRRARFGTVDPGGWIEVLDGSGLLGKAVVLGPGELAAPAREGARVRVTPGDASDPPAPAP